jgi:hypothetical protein
VAENISVRIRGSENECLTVMATIGASGRQNPLSILAHGKTTRVKHTQLGDVGEDRRDHWESVWMRRDAFGRSLELVRGAVEDRAKRSHLLLDISPVHVQQTASEQAISLNIQFHFIPSSRFLSVSLPF